MFTRATTKKILAYASAAAIISSNALAATQSVTANIAFDTPLALTKNLDIEFGVVKAGVTGTHTISTAGTVTDGGSAVWLSGSPHAADITIAGSATQTIDISVGGYTANESATPSNATCDYDGGGSGSCSLSAAAAPGAGKTLLVGVRLTLDGTAVAGDSSTPSFTITVVYS